MNKLFRFCPAINYNKNINEIPTIKLIGRVDVFKFRLYSPHNQHCWSDQSSRRVDVALSVIRFFFFQIFSNFLKIVELVSSDEFIERKKSNINVNEPSL